MNTKPLTLLYCLTFWQTSVLVPRSPTPRVSRIIRLLLWMTTSVKWFVFKPWITLAKFPVIVWERRKKYYMSFFLFSFSLGLAGHFCHPVPAYMNCIRKIWILPFFIPRNAMLLFMLLSLSLVSLSVLYFCCFLHKSLRLQTAGDVTSQSARCSAHKLMFRLGISTTWISAGIVAGRVADNPGDSWTLLRTTSWSR